MAPFSFFYRTVNGAKTGDMFMSLIHTCELCGINPFDYLTAIQTHREKVAATPTKWLPWNYAANLVT
jgi:hypothetical protein